MWSEPWEQEKLNIVNYEYFCKDPLCFCIVQLALVGYSINRKSSLDYLVSVATTVSETVGLCATFV